MVKELKINLLLIKEKQLSLDEYVTLKLLYSKEESTINDLFEQAKKEEIFNHLKQKNYLVNSNPPLYNKKLAEEALGLKPSGEIDASEFIDIFPAKVGTRALRPVKHSTDLYKMLARKYKAKVKTLTKHKEAVELAKIYVDNEMKNNGGQYIAMVQTIINKGMWDNWESLKEVTPTNVKDFN